MNNDPRIGAMMALVNTIDGYTTEAVYAAVEHLLEDDSTSRVEELKTLMREARAISTESREVAAKMVDHIDYGLGFKIAAPMIVLISRLHALGN